MNHEKKEHTYAELFENWAKQTHLETIIDKASKDSEVYKLINPNLTNYLNDISIQALTDFLKEGQNKRYDKSYPESVLYCIITAITNSQFEYDSKKMVETWIKNIDNLASLFNFSNEHRYLFSLIYCLETEKKKKIKLFDKLFPEIFTYVIEDTDLLPSDNDNNEKKYKLIYYIFHLLVELEYYNAAYRFYNGFIDGSVKDVDIQIDVIKVLTVECSLITTFNFLRKSGDSEINNKLISMIELAIQKNKIKEFVHLPFNPEETKNIQQILTDNNQFELVLKLFNDVRNTVCSHI